MTMDTIPLVHASLGEKELAAVAEVFSSGWPAGQGPRGKALELELAERYGVGGAVAVSNCGAALHLAMLALGVQPGDEVIVADYTFPAPAHAVRYVDAVPIFADVRADTGTVDPQAVADLIGPRTVGVIAVDTVGLPADYARAEGRSPTATDSSWSRTPPARSAPRTRAARRARWHRWPACPSTDARAPPAVRAAPCSPPTRHSRRTRGCARPSASAASSTRRRSSACRSRCSPRSATTTSCPTSPPRSCRCSSGRIGELLDRRRAIAARYAELLAGRGARHAAARAVGPYPCLAVLHGDAGSERGPRGGRRRSACPGHRLRARHMGVPTCSPCTRRSRRARSRPTSFERNLAIPMHAELSMSQVERVVESLRTALRG